MDYICINNNNCCDIDIILAVLTVVRLLRETSTNKRAYPRQWIISPMLCVGCVILWVSMWKYFRSVITNSRFFCANSIFYKLILIVYQIKLTL